MPAAPPTQECFTSGWYTHAYRRRFRGAKVTLEDSYYLHALFETVVKEAEGSWFDNGDPDPEEWRWVCTKPDSIFPHNHYLGRRFVAQMALTEIGSFDNLDRYSDWKIVLTCTDFTQAESEEFQRLCKANWRLPDDYDLLDPTHRPVHPPRPDPEPPQASPDCVYQPPQATLDCTIPPKGRKKNRRVRGKDKKSPVPHLAMPITSVTIPAAAPPLQLLVLPPPDPDPHLLDHPHLHLLSSDSDDCDCESSDSDDCDSGAPTDVFHIYMI